MENKLEVYIVTDDKINPIGKVIKNIDTYFYLDDENKTCKKITESDFRKIQASYVLTYDSEWLTVTVNTGEVENCYYE